MFDIVRGGVYFVSDAFFDVVKDPYLKINYAETKRPHYFAFKNASNGLYWLVPCSSKTEKFEEIIRKRLSENKRTDGIKIVNLLDKKTVLLFQDMFPVSRKYIKEPYLLRGELVRIVSDKLITELEKNAHGVLSMLRNGVKFTPTQPDVLRIETLMLEEVSS